MIMLTTSSIKRIKEKVKISRLIISNPQFSIQYLFLTGISSAIFTTHAVIAKKV